MSAISFASYRKILQRLFYLFIGRTFAMTPAEERVIMFVIDTPTVAPLFVI